MAGRRPGAYIEALDDSGGILSHAAKKLGVARHTFYKALRTFPEIADARQEAQEELKDMAEAALVKQIKDGNMTAIIFFLKCQARSRGYVERMDVVVQEVRERERAWLFGAMGQLDLTDEQREKLASIAEGAERVH